MKRAYSPSPTVRAPRAPLFLQSHRLGSFDAYDDWGGGGWTDWGGGGGGWSDWGVPDATGGVMDWGGSGVPGGSYAGSSFADNWWSFPAGSPPASPGSPPDLFMPSGPTTPGWMWEPSAPFVPPTYYSMPDFQPGAPPPLQMPGGDYPGSWYGNYELQWPISTPPPRDITRFEAPAGSLEPPPEWHQLGPDYGAWARQHYGQQAQRGGGGFPGGGSAGGGSSGAGARPQQPQGQPQQQGKGFFDWLASLFKKAATPAPGQPGGGRTLPLPGGGTLRLPPRSGGAPGEQIPQDQPGYTPAPRISMPQPARKDADIIPGLSTQNLLLAGAALAAFVLLSPGAEPAPAARASRSRK